MKHFATLLLLALAACLGGCTTTPADGIPEPLPVEMYDVGRAET